MDAKHYIEMIGNLNNLERSGAIKNASIYLFGHCYATEELAEILKARGYRVEAILDNNPAKQGTYYDDIPIMAPKAVLRETDSDTLVCVVARACEAMTKQLRQIGYNGRIEKLVIYNSFAEYSLSQETIHNMLTRLESGIRRLDQARKKYTGRFRVYCPFAALGDICFVMSYLPYYLKKKQIEKYVVFTVGKASAEAAMLYGAEQVEYLSQKDMDEQIQAVLYTNDKFSYIAHQDRPYLSYAYKALYVKCLSLETVYKCGVFGLSADTPPYRPVGQKQFEGLKNIPDGKSVVIAPYAKSVTSIKMKYWDRIRRYFQDKGYQVYTNVATDEAALPGTEPLEIPISQIQSVVERAGIFIGLRSGLCDVLHWANCRKIALYPDRFYSDTMWKVVEIYRLDGWENIVVHEDLS